MLKKYGRHMPDPSIVFKVRRRFKKMHNRSKDFIDNYIENAVVPIQVPELKKAIKQGAQLNLSPCMVNRYLKHELNLSYRKVKPISATHNKPQAKL
jgi:hypothetical protein